MLVYWVLNVRIFIVCRQFFFFFFFLYKAFAFVIVILYFKFSPLLS